MFLTPGPIDQNFSDGNLMNWHLEVLNNSNSTTIVYFTVYALYGLFPQPIPIGTTSADLKPGQYTFLSIDVKPKYEHTIPVIEVDSSDILVTLFGRTSTGIQLAGAVFPRKLLENLSIPIYTKCSETEEK